MRTIDTFFLLLMMLPCRYDIMNPSKKRKNRFQETKRRRGRPAAFENGKANVSLQFIPKDHPFYNLEGKDNIVLFYTDRYADQPLLIKGAGAGAAVTASGIFADVIRIGNN